MRVRHPEPCSPPAARQSYHQEQQAIAARIGRAQRRLARAARQKEMLRQWSALINPPASPGEVVARRA